MNFELTVQSLTPEMIISDEVKIACQNAMAFRFGDIATNNFGLSGEDRPTEWPDLSPVYASVYHDGNRIPTLELSGDLKSSIRIDPQLDAATVFTDNSYAAKQQWGDSLTKLPARPFFPIYSDGSFTPYTEAECLKACSDELERRIA
jgi:phage gpG-like protein